MHSEVVKTRYVDGTNVTWNTPHSCMRLSENATYHFSIDDSFNALIEATDRKIPLIKHPYFKYLYELHRKYGVKVSLYLFYRSKHKGAWRDLSQIRDITKEVVDEKGEVWLKFGPHALDTDTVPHSQSPSDQEITFERIYGEIDRFAGRATYARFVRLHYYSESYELAEYFRSKGVEALFSTERDVGSYRMPAEVGESLKGVGHATYKKMHFIRTQFRVEFFKDENLRKEDIKSRFQESLKKYGCVIFYTHECELVKSDIKKILNQSLEALEELGMKHMRSA